MQRMILNLFFRRLYCVVSFYIIFHSSLALALNPIIRPYQSVRSAGMGGVRITTGLYDENFFNNPARVTANPESKFTLLQLTPAEVTSNTLSVVKNLSGGTDALKVVSDASGKNLHNRTQLLLPGYYLASNENRRWAIAFALINSIQTDVELRQSYSMEIGAVGDFGPALTYGRTFLENRSLSVGITGHFTYRMATNPNYSLLDYVRGVPISANSIAGDGAMINFDIGTTYKITQWKSFDIQAGAAIQNALGGNYKNSLLSLAKNGSGPPPQLRSYGLGLSASRPEWWKFANTTFAFEITDILNNSDGSIFKLLHLGAETHWKSFAFRAGLNQGYLAGGLGIDFHYLTLDFATYGEELGLNTGILEDRRYTLNLGLHI